MSSSVPERPGSWRLFGLYALASLLLVVAAACGGDDDDTPTQPPGTRTPTAVTGAGQPKTEFGKKINDAGVPEQLADGTRLGAADAKVVIEAYEDFGCPHCLEFTAVIEPTLLREYVATGKVAFVYRFFPLRQLTGAAAVAAFCAGEQDKFWPYHRRLYVAQAEANEKSGPALAEVFAAEGLKTIAADLQLETSAFAACLQSDAAIGAVQTDLQKANELGLPGTPSFVINGKVAATPATLADWRKLLDGLLK